MSCLLWPARREKCLGSDPLVHIQRGFVTAGVTHYLGGNARHRGVGWHGLQYYAAGANLGTATYVYVAQHLGTCAYHHPFTDLGVAVTMLLASTAEGDVLQYGDIVLHYRCFTYDYARGMVKHDALTDLGGGMHIDAE